MKKSHIEATLFAFALLGTNPMAHKPAAAFAQQNSAKEPALITKIVPLTQYGDPKKLKLDTQEEKRKLSIWAITQHFNESLGASLPDDKKGEFKKWLTALFKKRFQSLVPTYKLLLPAAEKSGPGQTSLHPENVTLTFVIAEPILNDELLRSVFASYFSKSSPDNTVNQEIKLSSLLIDQQKKVVYYLPPDAHIENLANLSNSAVTFLPGEIFSGQKMSEADFSNPRISLAKKLGLLTSSVIGLGPKQQKQNWDQSLILSISEQIKNSYLINPNHNPIWPPALPLGTTKLTSENAQVFVFQFRSGEGPGILERLDFLRFLKKKSFSRQLWSRELLDPSYSLTTYQSVQKNSIQFYKTAAHATNTPSPSPAGIRFKIQKKLSDKFIQKLESVLKSRYKSYPNLLSPKEISKDDILYSTPLPTENTQKLALQLAGELTEVRVSALPGSLGMISIGVAQ